MSGDGNLKVLNVTGIKLNDFLLTSYLLLADANKWRGKALIPTIGEQNLSKSDDLLLREICFGYMPFTITSSEPITLLAELARFPFRIDGNLHYQSISCRLIPEFGKIDEIIFSEMVDVKNISPDRFIMEMGEIRLEVYFSYQNANALPNLQPRDGYKFDRYTSVQ